MEKRWIVRLLTIISFGAASLLAGCDRSSSQEETSASGASKGTSVSASEAGVSVGFVVTRFVHAFYSGEMAQDCPQGLAWAPGDNVLKKLTPSQRARLELKENERELKSLMARRGPEGLDLCRHPSAVADPGMNTFKGDVSYGLDLDGNTDAGAAGAAFKNPDGETGVDHAFHRVMGCASGLRSVGVGPGGKVGPLATTYEQLYVDSGLAILIQLDGVNDWVNDDDVRVGVHMSTTGIMKGGDGRPMADSSFSINPDPYWQSYTRGKIKDGTLITEPVELHLKDFISRPPGFTTYRGTKLKLKLNAETRTAQGILGTYHDIDSVYQNLLSSFNGEQVNGFSCDSVYYAVKRFADGFPDARTGRNSALSFAYHVEAIPAFVIPPSKAPAQASK